MNTLVLVCLSMLAWPSWSAVTKQQLAIPTYFSDTKLWSMVKSAGSGVGIAVVNPNSGPGTTRDPNYVKVIQDSVNANQKVIGYVDTGYFGLADNRKTRNGESSTTAWTKQVKEDVDKFYELYGQSGLSGIFLDDSLNTCGANNVKVNLYKNIYDYIKSKHSGAFVVLNPGSGVEQCYSSVADVLIVFEHDYQSYKTWTQPSWSKNQANGKQFWHLIYATKTQTDMENAVKLSKQRNAGYVYVTDDDLPNPWDTLPPYWQSELNLAAQSS